MCLRVFVVRPVLRQTVLLYVQGGTGYRGQCVPVCSQLQFLQGGKPQNLYVAVAEMGAHY